MNIALQAIRYIKTFLSDFLSPPACTYCNLFLSKRAVYCAPCHAQLQPVVSLLVSITTTKTVKVFAAGAYKDPIKRLVLAKMWRDVIATNHLADLIWDLTPLAHVPCDYLVPIPLHWTRQAKRGYNQAEEIARQLSALSGKPWVSLLKRARRTQFQSELHAEKRIENVADAFTLIAKDAQKYAGKHLIIVDDLYTTGATAKAAAKLLYQCKPASISVVVACRVV